MLNTILDAIYHTYLEEGFKERYGICSSIDFGNIDLEFLESLCNTDVQVIVKTKKAGTDTEVEKKWDIEDIIGLATAQGEEVGFKCGFLTGLLFSNQVNRQPINFNSN